MAEPARDKAKRLLVEGRLTVMEVSRRGVVAKCKGDSGDEYMLGYDAAAAQWRCTCPASSGFGRRCSHLQALMLVTVKPHEGDDGRPRT